MLPLPKQFANSKANAFILTVTGGCGNGLKESEGIYHNPKTILRVMQKYGLLAEIRRRRKWKQMASRYTNTRIFSTGTFTLKHPNSKWVTDISYIKTKQGVLYLSMIRDLYDNSIVSYKTATQQTVNLVLDTSARQYAEKRRRSLRNCSSTATKAFNTHPKHISS